MEHAEIFEKVAKEASKIIYGPVTKGQFFQGDIIRESGKLSEVFRKCYPEVSKNTPSDECFFIIVSQSCDLCYDKISHVNLALVRPLYRNLTYRNQIKNSKVGGIYLLKPFDYKSELQYAFNMINSASVKSELFLPKTENIPKNMVALLNQFFSLRIYGKHKEEKVKELESHRVASLSDSFRSKLGEKIADFYGRIDVPSLIESDNITDDELRIFVKQELKSVAVFNTLTDQAHKALKGNQTLTAENFMSELTAHIHAFESQKRIAFVNRWMGKISGKKEAGKFREETVQEMLAEIFNETNPGPKE